MLAWLATAEELSQPKEDHVNKVGLQASYKTNHCSLFNARYIPATFIDRPSDIERLIAKKNGGNRVSRIRFQALVFKQRGNSSQLNEFHLKSLEQSKRCYDLCR